MRVVGVSRFPKDNVDAVAAVVVVDCDVEMSGFNSTAVALVIPFSSFRSALKTMSLLRGEQPGR